MSEKRCTKCGVVKSLDEFYRNKSRRDGRSSRCKSCSGEESRNYYAAHPEKVRERDRKYRAANPGSSSRWAAANPQKNREQSRNYYAANPHTGWSHNYWKRIRRYGLEGYEEPFTKPDVIVAYGDHCFYCDDGAFEQLDHVIPVRIGGWHTLENVRPSCTACNRRRWHDGSTCEWAWEEPMADLLEGEVA